MSSDEFPETPYDRLNNAILGVLGCVAEAVEGICSYSWTVGDAYVPFRPDEDDGCDPDDETADADWCSQMWLRVSQIRPKDIGVNFDGQPCATMLEIDFEIGVLRCTGIPEGGEAPTATDVMAMGMQAMADMDKVMCAALACESIDSLNIGNWEPLGPLGGQYGGLWTFTAEF